MAIIFRKNVDFNLIYEGWLYGNVEGLLNYSFIMPVEFFNYNQNIIISKSNLAYPIFTVINNGIIKILTIIKSPAQYINNFHELFYQILK